MPEGARGSFQSFLERDRLIVSRPVPRAQGEAGNHAGAVLNELHLGRREYYCHKKLLLGLGSRGNFTHKIKFEVFAFGRVQGFQTEGAAGVPPVSLQKFPPSLRIKNGSSRTALKIMRLRNGGRHFDFLAARGYKQEDKAGKEFWKVSHLFYDNKYGNAV
ncbi:MAG: hypothetical protein A2901_03320 [Elusimicrobia bacterium RIFCSPLOWO2_01_FULL_54_10]|nr:MAG: hypothetical protein A2901_03320 [Elusimicrobia bacterium RIFCSPLOWO2_01_FULL_54_10]